MALIFGVLHLNPIAVLASIGLSLVYLVSGRLWVAVAVHAAGNLFHPMVGWSAFTVSWPAYAWFSAIAAVLLCGGMWVAQAFLRNAPRSYPHVIE